MTPLTRLGVLLISVTFVSCGTSDSVPTSGKPLLSSATGPIPESIRNFRYESVEHIQSLCMNGSTYDVPKVSISFYSSSVCSQSGCSDSVPCTNISGNMTQTDVLNDVGTNCSIQESGLKIVCTNLTLIQKEKLTSGAQTGTPQNTNPA